MNIIWTLLAFSPISSSYRQCIKDGSWEMLSVCQQGWRGDICDACPDCGMGYSKKLLCFLSSLFANKRHFQPSV